MREQDVQRLRDAGFEDAQILVAVQVIGYFNYINRLADALGVEPEPWMDLSHEEWLSQKGGDWDRVVQG